MRAALGWLRKYWFLLGAITAGVAWGADHYIDDRIDTKIGGVVKMLQNIQRDIAVIKDRLGIPFSPEP